MCLLLGFVWCVFLSVCLASLFLSKLVCLLACCSFCPMCVLFVCADFIPSLFLVLLCFLCLRVCLFVCLLVCVLCVCVFVCVFVCVDVWLFGCVGVS